MMEVQKEAQRIMTMSVWKMYHSRMQRGGLRLHRSLQLSLVMRSARDLYLSAKLEDDGEDEAMMPSANEGLDDGAPSSPPPTPFPAASAAQEEPPPEADPEPMDTQPEAEEEAAAAVERRAESAPPPRARTAKASRKRRSSSLGKMGALEAGLAPSKKARLAVEEPRQEEEKGEEEGQQQREEGPFPSLARVLQGRFSARAHAHPEPAKDEPPANCCRPQGEGVLSIMVRAVVAF